MLILKNISVANISLVKNPANKLETVYTKYRRKDGKMKNMVWQTDILERTR
ncbi:MAG: hypothetical protein BWX75_01219 [Candidatus Cloacimonetes bacterium ADurb.Bin088]|jgi:hypothetical protein|nr:MAG: hypothetical protein BWX75_01219 [Candidatus Cloacimonetes bacterium ADurb.Bin088]